MKHRFRAANPAWLGLLLIALMANAAMAGPDLVGNAASVARGNRDADSIDFHKWSGTGPKAATQKNLNMAALAASWIEDKAEIVIPAAPASPFLRPKTGGNGVPDAIELARAQLAFYAGVDPALKTRLDAIADQRLGKDLHPVEYFEWVKTLPDNQFELIRPPPNQIQIVDQDKLSKMTAEEKKNIKVKYRKTVVIPRTVHYKPVYKELVVAFPG